MGFCPGGMGALPAKALEVSTAFGVEDHSLLFEQYLLGRPCTDFALRIDDPLPGDRGPWRAITQGRHGITHLAGSHRWADHGGDLPIGGDAPGGNLPDNFIDTVIKRIGHGDYPQTQAKDTLKNAVHRYSIQLTGLSSPHRRLDSGAQGV